MCIFCDIAAGKIPSNTLYEDDQVIAFFDINPTSYGHCLVVPKQHCESFLDCPADVRDHVFEVAQKLANRLCDVLHCDGMNVLTNINEAAGQSVMHFHVHLIPRYADNDTLTLEFHEIPEVDFEELLKITK
ncbi:HIT family protein [Catenisphaera adipataccumulans]|jgi:histidine triad (HIT) family protein|uniref:Histidine triad (HIT) family protein n=1 Tax=Catenisphaera adipataccumulans TaxID=700500 RepID=A0A7W8CZY6_9FIRM|nr:HIT family protein [Catenisphaera adipataccumulans]MBB5183469.1 histidine triad (HIT) family protein [Catenisphaera adipataccumulans]